MEEAKKQNMTQDFDQAADESIEKKIDSMEKTKNQSHNIKKEALGPNTKR